MSQQLLRTSLCLAYCLLFSSFLFAQSGENLSIKYPKNAKVLYKTILVEDNIGKVVVNIGEQQAFQYEHWEGDAILVEQEIHYENAPQSVFKELMRKNRYTISEQFKSNTIVLQYDSIWSEDLNVNDQPINERVYLKLLVPEKMNVELKRKG